ncbi:MAG: DUF3164 family protein, partial [Alphaproteobacteria bacterium]|nr:DUF3164 family protein [Alphaproteobacteria bacterium]
MEEQKPLEGYMKDAKGRLVPENLVRDSDKLEDQTVRKIMEYAYELSGQIARFKGHCFDDIGVFMALLSEKYDVKKGGKKGNLTLTTYDGTAKVTIQVADRLTFGPELQIAKTLIDKCISKWSAGVNDHIRALVEHAFNVDKEGQVNREALFALRRVSIDDPDWQKAMEALTDSIRIVGSK